MKSRAAGNRGKTGAQWETCDICREKSPFLIPVPWLLGGDGIGCIPCIVKTNKIRALP